MTGLGLLGLGAVVLIFGVLVLAVSGAFVPADRVPQNELDDLRLAGGCREQQYGDQMICKRCNLVWDVNDLYPPDCLPWTQDDEVRECD